MLIRQLHIPLVVYYLNMFIVQLFFFISLKRKIGIRERSGKVHANVKQRIIHISDSVETNDFE